MATVKRKPVPPTYVPPNQESPASPHLPRKPESSSYSPTTPSTTTYDPHEGLLAGHAKAGSLSSSHPSASQQYIKWGIAWQGPTYMICLALLGISLALGHHFYFLSLDVTLAGSATRQQWSLRFGTGFSFLVVTCLKVASGQAYEQYMWTIIRRKSLSIGTLDRIFGLLSNPFGFFSLELFSQTRFVILLALICW
jgi:hypothetical protein